MLMSHPSPVLSNHYLGLEPGVCSFENYKVTDALRTIVNPTVNTQRSFNDKMLENYLPQSWIYSKHSENYDFFLLP